MMYFCKRKKNIVEASHPVITCLVSRHIFCNLAPLSWYRVFWGSDVYIWYCYIVVYEFIRKLDDIFRFADTGCFWVQMILYCIVVYEIIWKLDDLFVDFMLLLKSSASWMIYLLPPTDGMGGTQENWCPCSHLHINFLITNQSCSSSYKYRYKFPHIYSHINVHINFLITNQPCSSSCLDWKFSLCDILSDHISWFMISWLKVVATWSKAFSNFLWSKRNWKGSDRAIGSPYFQPILSWLLQVVSSSGTCADGTAATGNFVNRNLIRMKSRNCWNFNQFPSGQSWGGQSWQPPKL